MSLLDSLHEDKKLLVPQQVIQRYWDEHKEALKKKIDLVSQRAARDHADQFISALRTPFFDERTIQKIFDDESAEIMLRMQSRNLRSLEELFDALYHGDTIHEFTRGILGHLHIVLTQQTSLLRSYLDGNGSDEHFYSDMHGLLEYETNLCGTVDEYLTRFTEFLHALLSNNSPEQRMASEGQNHYKAIKSYFPTGTDKKTPIDQDIDALTAYLNQRAGRYENEEQSHDVLLRYANRADFLGEAQSVIESLHGQRPDPHYVQALVTHLREHLANPPARLK